MLLVKISFVSLMVGLIAISGRIWGAGVAGLLSGLPVIGGPIIWFIYQEYGLEFARHTAVATVGGIAALASFCFSYSWLCARYHWGAAYIFSCAAFFAIALFITSLNLSLNNVALLTLAIVFLQLMLFPALSAAPLSAPATKAEIVFRMGFAFVLVFCITYFAEILGHRYSGILTVFPIAGSAIAIFSHRNHSAVHAVQSLNSMMFGLLSMLVFFYMIAAFSAVNFTVSIFIASSVALAVQVVVLLFKCRQRGWS